MVVLLSEGVRKARKSHQCFHCYRHIGVGETYGYQTCKYDSVYTLTYHIDCEALASECRKLSDHYYDDEGWGPLRDEWCASGEYENECANWRGLYPHAVTRMELTDQLRVARCS